MPLNYINGATLSSSTLSNGYTDETNNRALLVETSTPSFRIYDLNTVSQIGSNLTVLSSPSAVCMINTASAVVVSSSSSTIDYIEVATNYRTNRSGAVTVPNTSKQNLAVDTSSSIAMAVTGTAKQLFKIDGSTFSTISNIEIVGSSTFTAITLKSTGRWLVGTSIGEIVEVDSSGKVWDRMVISLPTNASREPDSGSLLDSTVYGLSFDNNMLIVSTGHGMSLLYDWTTKTLLNYTDTHTIAPTVAYIFSNSASGIVCGASLSASNNAPIVAYDISSGSIDTDGYIFTGTSGTVNAIGINRLNNRGWYIQSTNLFRVFSLTPNKTKVQRTFTSQYLGQDVQVELMLLNYGASSIETPILHTSMQSPASYLVESGKTVLEVVKYGEGTNAQFAFNKYTS